MTAKTETIWIVDDDASIRRVLSYALKAAGRSSREFDSADSALEALEKESPAAIVTDLRMPGRSGIDLLGAVRARAESVPVIVMTAFADLDNSVAVLQGGAFEILPKPFDVDEAVELVERALANCELGANRPETGSPAPSLIGSAPAMKALFRVIGRLAHTDLAVLLIGESGTGKERIAQALHETSKRAAGPFVALNVAALPADLLESELFGHEQGAFSGAEQARAGYFEQAAGGTLFLDEIGEMPAPLQSRLLRVLAEGDFYRLGGRTAKRADVRVIAATNADLQRAVAEGRFRDDLYHRLNVVELRIPPLRERREDIDMLLEHYLRQAADELEALPKMLSADARRRLLGHDWPGNVRELVNLCRRLTALVPGPEVRADDLPSFSPETKDSDWTGELREWARKRFAEAPGRVLAEAGESLERSLIEEALKATGGKRGEAAKMLGMGRNTLTRKLDDEA